MSLNTDKRVNRSMDDTQREDSEIKPYKEALYITLAYILLGAIWILFSDTLVNTMFKSASMIARVQLFKGWLYVLLTGAYIFVLIYYRIRLLKVAVQKIDESKENVNLMTEELLIKDEQIHELSHFDRTSGLLNWLGLNLAFEQLIQKNKNTKYAFFYIDVDNIKHINDTIGHENGNLLLLKIGKKLSPIAAKNGLVARVSGDEFVLMIPAPDQINELHKLASRINKLLRTTWKVDKYDFLVTASIGITQYPEQGNSLESLLQQSDIAMFAAKDNGKDCYQLYEQKMAKKNEKYVEVISQIRHGIIKEEFELYYQPIVKLGNHEIVGVEALIRWNHPIRGFLTPYHFIEIAEESGQISEIGKWVFESACKQQKIWSDMGLVLKVSVNLSSKRLFNPNLIDEMRGVLDQYQIDAKRIQIEITETAVMENLNVAIKIMNQLRALGLTIALDDFGTGYSSLTYLKKFPIDVLKIDREFIKDISVKGQEKENAIINAVINLAHVLDLNIVAEGIETSEQAEFLLISGCDYGQGYYYNRPIKVDEITQIYGKSIQ